LGTELENGKYTTFWNWNSKTWTTIPADIPVGVYNAKAKIISKEEGKRQVKRRSFMQFLII